MGFSNIGGQTLNPALGLNPVNASMWAPNLNPYCMAKTQSLLQGCNLSPSLNPSLGLGLRLG